MTRTDHSNLYGIFEKISPPIYWLNFDISIPVAFGLHFLLLGASFGTPLGVFWAPLGSFGCSFGGLWVSFGHLLAPFWTPRDNFRDLQWRFGVPLLTLMFFLKPRLPLLIFAFPLASNSILDPRMLLGSCGAQLHARLSSFQCIIICPVCFLV